MSTHDHPGAEYEPEIGPQIRLEVEFPTHRLAQIAKLLELTVDQAVLHFEEDALHVDAVNRENTRVVSIREESIEYTTDHQPFSVGVKTEQFRSGSRLIRPDQTTRLSFKVNSDEATAHSGNTMDYIPLLDPAETRQPEDVQTDNDWTYEAVVESKALKQAIAGVVDCTAKDYHLLGYGELGIRGKNPKTGEYDRYEPVPVEDHPDGVGHAFLGIRETSSVIDALPLGQSLTVRLGERLPVQIETDGGTTITMAPRIGPDDDGDHLETIFEEAGVDA